MPDRELSLKTVMKYSNAVSKAIGKVKGAPLVLNDAIESIVLICYHLNKTPSSVADPRLPSLLYDSSSVCLALSCHLELLEQDVNKEGVSFLKEIAKLALYVTPITNSNQIDN